MDKLRDEIILSVPNIPLNKNFYYHQSSLSGSFTSYFILANHPYQFSFGKLEHSYSFLWRRMNVRFVNVCASVDIVQIVLDNYTGVRYLHFTMA